MPEALVGVEDKPSGAGIADMRTRDRGSGRLEQYIIPTSERVRTGLYLSHFLGVVQATAHNGTTTGFFWIHNSSATLKMALRRFEFQSQIGSTLVTPTSPRIALSRFTSTGTPTGAVNTVAKRDSVDAANAGTVRTASTGLTVTLGSTFYSFLPTASITAAGGVAATAADWNPDEEAMVVLGQNEGVVCWQPDAGTTADTRRFVLNLAWEEYTVP